MDSLDSYTAQAICEAGRKLPGVTGGSSTIPWDTMGYLDPCGCDIAESRVKQLLLEFRRGQQLKNTQRSMHRIIVSVGKHPTVVQLFALHSVQAILELLTLPKNIGLFSKSSDLNGRIVPEIVPEKWRDMIQMPSAAMRNAAKERSDTILVFLLVNCQLGSQTESFISVFCFEFFVYVV